MYVLRILCLIFEILISVSVVRDGMFINNKGINKGINKGLIRGLII